MGDLGVDGRTTSKWIIGIRGGCNWIHVFQNGASNEMQKRLIFVNAEDMKGSGPDMFKRNIHYDHQERLRECT